MVDKQTAPTNETANKKAERSGSQPACPVRGSGHPLFQLQQAVGNQSFGRLIQSGQVDQAAEPPLARDALLSTGQFPEAIPALFFDPRFGYDSERIGCADSKAAAPLQADPLSVAPVLRKKPLPIQSIRANRALLQRAEVDDNPAFCFPPGQTPLQDSRDTINRWIAGARTRAERDSLHIVNAIYQELGTGTGHTNVEQRLAALPASQVRHVSMGESRYAGAMMWPVDPLTRLGLSVAGKIAVAPVINLCGVCVGTDKVGHFFQQGYEYFRLGQELRARVEAMSLEEKRQFLARLQGSPAPSPFSLGTESESGSGVAGFELTEAAYPELITTAFVMQYGQWLEGFNQQLSQEDIRWIRSRSFIPWYYSEGIYGSGSTGILSRADLQANRMGYWFYRDLWNDPALTPNICDYVGELWNERREVSSYLPEVGTPRGPASYSLDAESP